VGVFCYKIDIKNYFYYYITIWIILNILILYKSGNSSIVNNPFIKCRGLRPPATPHIKGKGAENRRFSAGKTKQQNQKRFNSYPKGSILIQQFYCYDCDNIEKQIITLFNTKYKKRPEYGNEYYEGIFKQMIIDINKIIDLETEIENDKTKIITTEIVNDIIDDLITYLSEEKKIIVEPMVGVAEETVDNTKGNYLCKCCNFYTRLKGNYDRHILTTKHINIINKTEDKKPFCCGICNKKYKSNNGLWNHNKKCIVEHKKINK
jgi:hypothetical protein